MFLAIKDGFLLGIGSCWVCEMQDIQSTIEKIKQIVIPVIEEEGLELFDIELRRGKGRGVLRIFIEKSTGRVSIRDCEVVSKQISVLKT